jgi:UDP-glucose 4-epimerase
MRALVIGGAGFIGSHVVDKLIDNNVKTSVLVSGFRSKNHPSIVNESANIIKGDIRDYESLVDATKDVDVVFHLGGVFSHYVDKFPELAIDVNIKGIWTIKKACVFNGVKRIVFASSSFVYGDSTIIPVSEDSPTNPKDLLGVTKLAGEKILQASYPDRIDYTILRLFNVYGPRQYPDDLYTSVVSTWIKQALEGKSLEIHDDGTQALDFIYVGDVAEAFILSLGDRAKNEVFNVGSGVAISMNELAMIVNRLAGNKSPPVYNRRHPMFLKHIVADIKKIKSTLGWSPSLVRDIITDIDKPSLEGLHNTVDFVRRNQ